MRLSTTFHTLALASVLTLSGFAVALADSSGDSVQPVFKHKLPNVEGKSLVAFVVSYAPGGTSHAHHHAKSAFVYAQVLTGAIRSKVGDAPVKIYHAGENFYENPEDAHHISENASKTEPASLLAVFVVNSNDEKLTVPSDE